MVETLTPRPGSPIPYFDQESPYPWQIRAYQNLLRGVLPDSPLYLPTGTGKTSIALLYLLAVIQGAPLPRRLVYIVDRRAIVDQTRERIEEWVRHLALFPELFQRVSALAAFSPAGAEQFIPVGVLRGGVADTGKWRIDPARPSVVVGTVDMIGSRLLFSGYGDGRSRRSLHAGLLGHDTTIMLDEAHLSAPMDHLLRAIKTMQSDEGPDGADGRPTVQVLAMSATPMPNEPVKPAWNADDEAHSAFRARVRAPKRCHMHAVGSKGKRPTSKQRRDKMVEIANSISDGAIVVYVQTVADATSIHASIAKVVGKDRCRLLTGTLRGRERRILFESKFWKGFSPSRSRRRRPAPHYLVSTSAGEVGIDIDADHAVMDLATMDSMVQRVGRVNRNGAWKRCDVHVVHNAGESDEHKQATFQLLQAAKGLSPAQIAELAESNEWPDSFSAPPTIAPVGLERVEWMAATSNPRRDPAIPLFLRGYDDKEDIPDVQVVWRWDLPLLMDAGEPHLTNALEAFPPLPDELLNVPARFAATEVRKTAEPTPKIVLRDRQGDIRICSTEDVASEDIAYGTLFLPTEGGGLTRDGLLNGNASAEVLDCGDNEERVRYMLHGPSATASVPQGWKDQGRVVLRVPIEDGDPDDPGYMGPESWLMYRKRNVDELAFASDQDELTAIGDHSQTLAAHSQAVAQASRSIADALRLPAEFIAAICTAGDWHDRGKAEPVWQRAAGTDPEQEPMAKSVAGRFNARLLAGYRHEFGSLVQAEESLANDQGAQVDLILHLIAAHHGHARPGFADRRHWGQSASEQQLERIAHRAEVRFA